MKKRFDVREILEEAKAAGYALGAFNAVNLETLKAIALAARNRQAPVIVETSPGETKYAGAGRMRALVDSFIEETGIPMILNLDHGLTLTDCMLGIEAGYDYIHCDGSELAYDENLKLSKKVVALSHEKGMLAEAEIGHIQLGSELRMDVTAEEAQAKSVMTDPELAKKFVAETGLDTLAVFVGNLHGVYKTVPKLDMDLLAKLSAELTCFFSLHGGSGIEDEEVAKAVKVGNLVKINVNTELRVAFKDALKDILNESDQIALYKISPPAIEAMQKVVEHKIDVFGSANKAKLLR